MNSNSSSLGLNSTIYSNMIEEKGSIIKQGNQSRLGGLIASHNMAVRRIADNLMRYESIKALNEIEAAILRSKEPLEIDESEEVTVNGHSGILVNKCELDSWNGPLPLSQYPINQDDQPEVITKRSSQQIEYIKELAIRYLKPPTPQEPGEIIIKQLPNQMMPPAPPLILRQQPARAETPEPLVIREAPPHPPSPVNRRIITISGKQLPPPPRKVVIERLAPLPSKPQSVIIERWLPYEQLKRKVIFKKPVEKDPVVVNPKNVIVQWEPPQVQIRQEYKHLGVVRANPQEYVQRYGSKLLDSKNLPEFVLNIKAPEGIELAADQQALNKKRLHELEGDIEALRLVDLEKEGLAEYRPYLNQLLKSNTSNSLSFGSSNINRCGHPCSHLFINNNLDIPETYFMNSSGVSSNSDDTSKISFENGLFELRNLVEQIFRNIDKFNTGFIGKHQAQNIILKLNSKLNRKYREEDIVSFFNQLDINRDNLIDLNEFNTAFLNLAASTLINSID